MQSYAVPISNGLGLLKGEVKKFDVFSNSKSCLPFEDNQVFFKHHKNTFFLTRKNR